MSDHYLIIDDIDESLLHLSSFGRSSLGEHSSQLREAVTAFSARRGWSMVPYFAFAKWAQAIRSSSQLRWIVLDPLFPTQSEERAITLRPSQQYNNLREVAGPIQSESDCVELSGDIGVLDDAASYGRTLRYVACLAARVGCSIESVVLCGSLRGAQASVHAAMKATQWQSYIRGDWKVLHLRDGCPYLPFSGRPIGRSVLINSFESSVELRVLAVSIAGNLWQVLLVDRKIRYAISLARRRKPITLATADDRCGAPLNSAN